MRKSFRIVLAASVVLAAGSPAWAFEKLPEELKVRYEAWKKIAAEKAPTSTAELSQISRLLKNVAVVRETRPYQQIWFMRSVATGRAYTLAKKHLERDDQGKLTETGTKAARLIAGLMQRSYLAAVPESAALLEGLSSAEAQERTKAFDAAIRGDQLQRALLRCVLEGDCLPERTRVVVSRGTVFLGEQLGHRREHRPGHSGAWLAPPQDAIVTDDPVRTRFILKGRMPPPRRGIDEDTAGSFGYRTGGGKKRNPVFRYRLHHQGDPELVSVGRVRPQQVGCVSLRWTTLEGTETVPVPREVLPKGEREAWSVIVTEEKRNSQNLVVPVVPPKAVMGRPHDGLKLTVLGPTARHRRILMREFPAVRDHTVLLAAIRTTDTKPHALLTPMEGDGFLWAFIFDDTGAFVKLVVPRNRETVFYTRPAARIVKLLKNSDHEPELIFPDPGPPGKYKAIVVYGPIVHDKANPPDAVFWQGQLVSELVEFEVLEKKEKP